MKFLIFWIILIGIILKFYFSSLENSRMSLTLMQFEKKKFKLKLKVIQLLWTFYIKVRISVIFLCFFNFP